jgi:dolichol-phosphate mannosyltransferase
MLNLLFCPKLHSPHYFCSYLYGPFKTLDCQAQVETSLPQKYPETLSILIPAYNESRTIVEILDKVRSVVLDLNKEIIIVDDGSKDNTYELVEKWNKSLPATNDLKVILIKKPNGGKGSAIREAIQHSTGEYAIVQDADMEYDPQDYIACLAPIRSGQYAVVYGSRYMHSQNHASYYRYYLGGRMVSLFTNLLFFSKLTDEPTCYKTFRGDLIRQIPFEGNTFDWEPEITAKLLRLGYAIGEVPISYFPRHFEDGKKIGVKDGVLALWTLLKWRFASLGDLKNLKRTPN